MKRFPFKIIRTASHEAHDLAGGPVKKEHSTAHLYGAGIATSTAAGVGTYQINRKIAKHQGEAPPPISATTGGTPDIGETVAPKVKRKRKGGH